MCTCYLCSRLVCTCYLGGDVGGLWSTVAGAYGTRMHTAADAAAAAAAAAAGPLDVQELPTLMGLAGSCSALQLHTAVVAVATAVVHAGVWVRMQQRMQQGAYAYCLGFLRWARWFTQRAGLGLCNNKHYATVCKGGPKRSHSYRSGCAEQ